MARFPAIKLDEVHPHSSTLFRVFFRPNTG
jgi:hypothetical protein